MKKGREDENMGASRTNYRHIVSKFVVAYSVSA